LIAIQEPVKSVKATNMAIKEFEVSIRTRRFQIIIALFAIISLGMIYSSKRLGISVNLYKTPFQMLFLSSFSNAFNYSISLLGILLGTTANEEIETGNPKLVAPKPAYRDEIIAGKLLGGLLTLSVALALFYILTVAFALILGGPITGDDLVKFLATFPFSVLYGLIFLNLGLLISTLVKKSRNALIMSIFLFVFFGFLLSIIAKVVALAVAGLPPVPDISENVTNLSDEQLREVFLKDPTYRAWLIKMTITAERILYISPNYHYQEILQMLFGRKPQISDIVSALAYGQSLVEERSIVESLGFVWKNIIALLVMFIFSFVSAYLRFMTKV